MQMMRFKRLRNVFIVNRQINLSYKKLPPYQMVMNDKALALKRQVHRSHVRIDEMDRQ